MISTSELIKTLESDVINSEILVKEFLKQQQQKQSRKLNNIFMKTKYNPNKLKGSWQVITTITGPKGTPQWSKYSTFVTAITKSLFKENYNNKNFQIFDEYKSKPESSFINLSEYYGKNFYATASGYCLLRDNKENDNFPIYYNAYVNNITINLLGKYRLTFPVEGKGQIKILYSDDDIRIVENEDGAKAIQKKVPTPADYYSLLLSLNFTNYSN
jgi:hypothetical protein